MHPAAYGNLNDLWVYRASSADDVSVTVQAWCFLQFGCHSDERHDFTAASRDVHQSTAVTVTIQ